MSIGRPMGLHVGHTSTIRRIEGAMLSYVADMDIRNNPYELGLERLVDLNQNFIGKEALKKINNDGVSIKFCGFEIDGPPLANPTDEHIDITYKSEKIGYITSSVFSPRLKKNIGLGYFPIRHSYIGFEADTKFEDHKRKVKIVEKPFIDPNKNIAKGIKN